MNNDQRDALLLIADCLERYLHDGDWHHANVSPFTGHSGYVVLCNVYSHLTYSWAKDVELYEGQRAHALSLRTDAAIRQFDLAYSRQ